MATQPGQPATLSADIGTADWFAAVLEACSDMILVKDPQSRLLWANRAFRDLYGLSNEELRQQFLDGAQSDPDDTLQYVRDDLRVVETGEPLDVGIEPVTDTHGRVHWFHTIKAPILDDTGRVRATVGVSRAAQTSGQVVAGEEARAVRHLFLDSLRDIIASLPTATATFDRTGMIIAWSPAFERALTDADAVPPDGLHARTALTDIIDVGEPPTLRHRTTGATPTAHIDVDVQEWATETGRGGFVVDLHDVTTLVRTTDRLAVANDELTQFNYRASHDLRGPLASVLGLLGLAAESLDDGEYADVGQLISTAAGEVKRLQGLVADLIELARADAASDDVSPADLAAIVADVLSAPQFAHAGVEVTVVDRLRRPITTNAVRVRQILDNLVSNAIKFTDPDEPTPTITIETDGTTRDGTTEVTIVVTDNGLGIDPSVENEMFDLFAKGRQGDGHGMGLFIVAKHLAHLGGSISVVSPRKPTRLRVVLPVATDQT